MLSDQVATENPIDQPLPTLVAAPSGDVAEAIRPQADEPFAPKFPEKLDDLDIGAGFLCDLALKAVSMDVDCTTTSVANRLHLGVMTTDLVLERLCAEKFVEKKGVFGLHKHNFAMLDRG